MLQVYKRYKISNADVRTIPPKFRSAGLIKQWVITSKTVIEEVDANEDIMPVKFAFTDFADLAEYMDDRTKSVGEYATSLVYHVFITHRSVLSLPSLPSQMSSEW